MPKEDFFSIFGVKDYNNELEKVLEKKSFSEDTKNLLLSMLYKMETNYPDYERIKREVLPKKVYMNQVIQMIKKDCDEIEVIDPKSDKYKEMKKQHLEYEIDSKNQKIRIFPNEITLLTAILEVSRNQIQIDNNKKEWDIEKSKIIKKQIQARIPYEYGRKHTRFQWIFMECK